MNLTKTAASTALKLRKHSPNILFVTGIAGTVATVVVACRATLKAQKVAETHKAEIAKADLLLEEGKTRGYNVEAHKQNIIGIWTATSVQYTKLYGPAFILGVTSIACLTKSHQILTSRNTAVMAAYAGLDGAFKRYRGRVVEELGVEKDTEFAHGKATKEIVEYDAKGNPIVKQVTNAPKDAKTAYGQWFDETNRHWDKDHGYNHTFLDNQQKWANLELKRHGHLFLNEVYSMLGIEHTAQGAVVGWMYYGDENSDGYIDFGFNRYPDFVAGFERSVFLDFNVDGVILDKLPQK